MTVTACAIVEGIYVVSDIPYCGIPIFINVLSDPFLFQPAKERLCHRVVPAIASAAHAGFKMIPFAEAPPGVTAVLGTLIRMNQCMARSPATHGHQDSVQHQFAMNRRTGRPANDPSRIKIHDHSQIQPPLPSTNVGNICDPNAIRFSHGELPLEHIWNQHRRLANSNPSCSIAVQRAQAILAHQAFDSVFTTSLASLTQIQKRARRTIDTVAGDKGSTNQSQQPGVLLGTIRNRVFEPFVIAARRDLEHFAHASRMTLKPNSTRYVADRTRAPSLPI
jgi:hypothetical protein